MKNYVLDVEMFLLTGDVSPILLVGTVSLLKKKKLIMVFTMTSFTEADLQTLLFSHLRRWAVVNKPIQVKSLPELTINILLGAQQNKLHT